MRSRAFAGRAERHLAGDQGGPSSSCNASSAVAAASVCGVHERPPHVAGIHPRFAAASD